LLLANGAAVDVLDDDRCTPLHHAGSKKEFLESVLFHLFCSSAFNGRVEMVQVLLQQKSDSEAVDSSDVNAFAKACFRGFVVFFFPPLCF
jgi:ankyrin repeat protein